MPHLSQLQREYKGKNVTIIGVTSEDERNSLDAVRTMVEAKGDVMGYTVAWDTEQETHDAYMKAAKQRGIPASFLVDKAGRVAWIGHPAEADIPLAKVVAGTWDYVEGPAMMKRINDAKRAIMKASKSEPEAALELLTKLEQEYPLAAQGMQDLRFTLLSQIPARAEEATKVGHQIVAKAVAEKNAPALNQFAWTLVDPAQKRDNRFLDLALLAADKANEFSGDKDPAILDTVARVHFWRGDLTKAIQVQKRAVEHAEGEMKAELEKAQQEYAEALKKNGAA